MTEPTNIEPTTDAVDARGLEASASDRLREERRAALARIGAIAAVAPAVALLLRPDPGRASNHQGSIPGCRPSENEPNKCETEGQSGFFELESTETSLAETTTLSEDPSTTTSLGISTSVQGYE